MKIGLRVRLRQQGTDLSEGLNHTNFVISRHHRHQNCIGTDRRRQIIKIHQTIGLHRQEGQLKAQPRQITQGI